MAKGAWNCGRDIVNCGRQVVNGAIEHTTGLSASLAEGKASLDLDDLRPIYGQDVRGAQKALLFAQGVEALASAREVARILGSAATGGKIVMEKISHQAANAKPILSNLFNFQRSSVSIRTVGMEWGRGNIRQGMPWEDFVGRRLPADARLPSNFKTFDYYDAPRRTAISAKTLDTQTASRLARPSSIFNTLRRYVDDVRRFDQYNLSGRRLTGSMISNREIRLAVPAATTSSQWIEINRAVSYAREHNVKIIITEITR